MFNRKNRLYLNIEIGSKNGLFQSSDDEYHNNLSNQEVLAKDEAPEFKFEVEIVPTSDSLKDDMVFYKGALDGNPEGIDSYHKAMEQAEQQNSFTAKISFDNENFINDGSITSKIRSKILRIIDGRMKENGFDGKGLYSAFYDGVDFTTYNMDEEETNMHAFHTSNASTAFAPNGVLVPWVRYQYDVSKEEYPDYPCVRKIEEDKKQIQGIVEEIFKEAYNELQRDGLLIEVIKKSDIDLNWSQDKCLEQDTCIETGVESNIDKGKSGKVK